MIIDKVLTASLFLHHCINLIGISMELYDEFFAINFNCSLDSRISDMSLLLNGVGSIIINSIPPLLFCFAKLTK